MTSRQRAIAKLLQARLRLARVVLAAGTTVARRLHRLHAIDRRTLTPAVDFTILGGRGERTTFRHELGKVYRQMLTLHWHVWQS